MRDVSETQLYTMYSEPFTERSLGQEAWLHLRTVNTSLRGQFVIDVILS